jgi:ribonuclease BN (tRNA processing enzyme)
LLLDRVEALGVPKGASLGLLKDGRSIVTPEGRLVTPDMVLTEVKPGRKILIMGMCSNCDTLAWHEATKGVDVMIAGGTISSDVVVAAPLVGSQLLAASALGKTAAQIHARHVLLARFDWRVHGQHVHPYEDPVVKRLVLEVARELGPQHRVTAIHDFWVHVMEKHEGRDWKALEG